VAAEAVARLPGVTGLSRHGAALEILASHAEPVVLALLQQDPGLSDLEVSGVGLEQAFLSLTRAAQKEAA
ncbi:MAG TPA: ABC transporter ATP-binding protein, partial [Gammaproteobacteria bacterium]|nr:ABC transporter ATP-binding protein [Gammaproteobacteria bacterium]